MIRKNGHVIASEFADGHSTSLGRNFTSRHPVDDLEPTDELRDELRAARVKCVRVLNSCFSHIEGAILRPGSTKQDIAVAFYQAAYGAGSNICEGLTMTKRAEMWGVERATISKGATAFCTGNDMPPSYYMKNEGSAESYATARIERVRRGENKPSQ